MFVQIYSGPCKYGRKCSKKMCTFQHDLDENDSDKEFKKRLDESDQNIEYKARMVKTSTPKKRNFGCEDCANESELSECVDCIVKRVRAGYGGMTTASSLPPSGSVDMGSSSCSTSGCSGVPV